MSNFKRLMGAGRAGSGLDRRAAARIKDWTRKELALGEEDAVSVNEIECDGACCPEIETVILVMRAGRKTVSYKLLGSAALASREDVAEAIKSRPALRSESGA